MSQPTYGPHNPHPLSQMQTELTWEEKYDEHGNRQEVDRDVGVMSIEKIYERLHTNPQQLQEFCRKWHVIELAVYGSILRDDFRLEGKDMSDIDLLFTNSKDARKNLILQVRIKFELEELLHRGVDLVSKTAIQADPNYIRRQNILESARIIYVER